MRSVRIWICFAICFLVFELALAKKEDKSFKDGPTTGMTQYVDLVKYIYKHALSKADPASVRGLFTGPLSFLVYGASLLIGGIVLLAFYESPLSPLPVPPLPHPPVGRFPPEHPVWPVNRLHRASQNSGSIAGLAQNFPPLNFPNPAQFIQNPTQYQFVSSASQRQPLMVEKPVSYHHQHVNQQHANIAQRRASNSPHSQQNPKNTQTLPQQHHFQPVVQPSTSLPSNHQAFHSPSVGIAAENSFDKRISSADSEIKPARSQTPVPSAVPLADHSVSNKFVVPGHKPSDLSSVNGPLSNVNLLNVVNGNNVMRRSEESAELKQQQLVQAQLNQVHFSSSPALTQLESQVNRP